MADAAGLVPALLDDDPGTHARRRPPSSGTTRTVDVGSVDEAVEAGKDGLRQSPWDLARATVARQPWPRTRSPCGASSGPTAASPSSEDEPDLVAYVARSY